MYKKLTLIIFLAMGFSFSATAQHAPGVCGTVGEWAQDVSARLLKNREHFRNNPIQSRAITYVPIKFHLVARSNGTGRIPEGRVYDQLCKLNEDYFDVEMQFYIADGTFNYINNTTIYETAELGSAQIIMNTQKVNYAINIFVCLNANTGGGGPGVTLAYYSGSRDWIVTRMDEVNGSTTTLAHELGHFFSLPHPFNGWDAEYYNESMHGNPVQSFSPSGIPTEKVSGSNCLTAGDFTCDTNPNYGFGFGWDDCDYDAGTMDPDGVIVDPQENLFMGYFFGCPRDDYYFSDTQIQDMQNDLASSGRNYINPGITPNLTPITQTPELIYPPNAAVVSYNAVPFEWEDVPGADFYLLEYNNLPSFSSSTVQRLIVYGNSKILELEPSKPYFWRVRPLNAYYTCANVTQFKAFNTDNTTAVHELDFVGQWVVSPNPVVAESSLHLYVEASKAFEANIQLLSINGQQVQDFGRYSLTTGSNSFNLQIGNLPKGIYTLSMITEEGVAGRRLVIQ